MLTKEDLQQIKNIVKGETDPLRDDIKELKTDMKVVKKDITKIRKDIDTVVSVFDRDYLELRQRIDRLEEYLKIPNLQ